jgi:hypothetical protein
MALDQTKIVSNTKKYFETATKHGFMNDNLMNFLGEEFIKAPASNMLSYHYAFEGGLIEYLLRVAFYAVRINNSLPEEEKVDQSSLLKVCLLHGIGKAKLYKPCESEWHRKNQGKMYDFVDNLVSMHVGERSVYYALSHGINLTEEEYSAILFYDKVDDKMVDYHNSMVGELLKMGITLAIKHSKKN